MVLTLRESRAGLRFLRYRVDGTDTGFSGEEGTFTICSFWLVSALAMIGETDRARALCHKLLSFAGPLLLYAEEIDTTTGEHLGNFPQAFTHLALIEAVSLLIWSELAEDVKSAGWDPAASAVAVYVCPVFDGPGRPSGIPCAG